MNQVAEGVKASNVIVEFADEYGLNMPIGREVDGVTNHNSPVEQAYPRSLAAEKPGHEVHGRGSRTARLQQVGVDHVGLARWPLSLVATEMPGG
jgi:hypothetical protein